MHDFAHIKTMAAQWRQDNGYVDKGGVIVIYRDEVQGWVNELRDPSSWRPGCIATDSDGNHWLASGGNDQDGATEWQPAGPAPTAKKLSELYPPLEMDAFIDKEQKLTTALPAHVAALLQSAGFHYDPDEFAAMTIEQHSEEAFKLMQFSKIAKAAEGSRK
jgi:hypothetical protein